MEVEERRFFENIKIKKWITSFIFSQIHHREWYAQDCEIIEFQMSNVLPCVDPDQCLKKDGCQLFQICAKSGHHFLWKLPCSHHGCTAEILIPTHPKILQAFQYMGSKFHIQSKKILNQMQRFLHILEKFLFSQMIVSPKTSTLIF